jgi:hypothetical protein
MITLNRQQHSLVLRVLASIAMDVMETHRITEHIAHVAPHGPMQEGLVDLIAQLLGSAESGMQGEPREYLDQMHYVMGRPHLKIIEWLREAAFETSPQHEDEGAVINTHGYGYARTKPEWRDPEVVWSLTGETQQAHSGEVHTLRLIDSTAPDQAVTTDPNGAS